MLVEKHLKYIKCSEPCRCCIKTNYYYALFYLAEFGMYIFRDTETNKQTNNLFQVLLAGGSNKRKKVAKQCRDNVDFEIRKNINILADTAAKSARRRIKDNRDNHLPRQ